MSRILISVMIILSIHLWFGAQNGINTGLKPVEKTTWNSGKFHTSIYDHAQMLFEYYGSLVKLFSFLW